MSFVRELDKLKAVTRKVKPLGQDRYENPAEHSWQIALWAMALLPQLAPELDQSKVLGMLLVHDVGEIDTGDTLAFVTEGADLRKAAEQVAARRIFGMLEAPVAEPLLALWHEFDREESREARFAHALDRAMPVLLNLANQGQSWRENGISYERVVARVRGQIEGGCPELWQWLEPQMEAAARAGYFGA